MSIGYQQKGIRRFGSFELDPAGELRSNGKKVKLQDQPLQILQILTERHGQIVTREELRAKIWPSDTFVDFDHGINNAIKRLREALGDTAKTPRFIETLPRRGYRFIAPVVREAIAGSASSAQLQAEVEQPPTHPRRDLRIGLFLGLAASALLIIVLGAGPAKIWHMISGKAAAPQIRSIAILPLKNLSGDPDQQYFADGMTEELITSLSQIRALKVISRTSAEVYAGTHKPLPQIARELNVDAIVEGSVQRTEGQVRITAQLIYAPEDKNVWAQTYVRDARGALTLQGEVATAIANQVERALSPPRPLRAAPTPANPEAHDLYLKGRYYWNQRTQAGFWKAIESFKLAIEKDPNYAQAYAGLADCYILLGPNDALPSGEVYPLARSAALRALQLDDALAEAHSSLGFVILLYDWNPAQAEKEFRRAIELNPNYPTAHHWYAYDLAAMKRPDEAIAEIRRALDLDPLSPIINTDLGQVLLFAHRNDEAIAQCQKTIALDPQFTWAYWYLGLLYEQKGMYDQAFDALLKSLFGPSGSPQSEAFRAAYRASGIKGYWQQRVSQLEQQSKERYVSPYTFAVSYARLGQPDKALESLEKAFDERYPSMVFLPIEPVFDTLRGHPRFEELMRRINLPQT
jgi:TolB-like protein/DNA-binding winged helix-turn-helix (wHTH) protein/Tfp pilus assembly protein PilF